VKASFNQGEGRFYLNVRVWCTLCAGSFEFTDEHQLSADRREVRWHITPAAQPRTLLVSGNNTTVH
jgi:hypothetical protein